MLDTVCSRGKRVEAEKNEGVVTLDSHRSLYALGATQMPAHGFEIRRSTRRATEHDSLVQTTVKPV